MRHPYLTEENTLRVVSALAKEHYGINITSAKAIEAGRNSYGFVVTTADEQTYVLKIESRAAINARTIKKEPYAVAISDKSSESPNIASLSKYQRFWLEERQALFEEQAHFGQTISFVQGTNDRILQTASLPSDHPDSRFLPANVLGNPMSLMHYVDAQRLVPERVNAKDNFSECRPPNYSEREWYNLMFATSSFHRHATEKERLAGREMPTPKTMTNILSTARSVFGDDVLDPPHSSGRTEKLAERVLNFADRVLNTSTHHQARIHSKLGKKCKSHLHDTFPIPPSLRGSRAFDEALETAIKFAFSEMFEMREDEVTDELIGRWYSTANDSDLQNLDTRIKESILFYGLPQMDVATFRKEILDSEVAKFTTNEGAVELFDSHLFHGDENLREEVRRIFQPHLEGVLPQALHDQYFQYLFAPNSKILVQILRTALNDKDGKSLKLLQEELATAASRTDITTAGSYRDFRERVSQFVDAQFESSVLKVAAENSSVSEKLAELIHSDATSFQHDLERPRVDWNIRRKRRPRKAPPASLSEGYGGMSGGYQAASSGGYSRLGYVSGDSQTADEVMEEETLLDDVRATTHIVRETVNNFYTSYTKLLNYLVSELPVDLSPQLPTIGTKKTAKEFQRFERPVLKAMLTKQAELQDQEETAESKEKLETIELFLNSHHVLKHLINAYDLIALTGSGELTTFLNETLIGFQDTYDLFYSSNVRKVLVHGDANPTNFLQKPDGTMTVVDLDEMHWNSPLRDIIDWTVIDRTAKKAAMQFPKPLTAAQQRYFDIALDAALNVHSSFTDAEVQTATASTVAPIIAVQAKSILEAIGGTVRAFASDDLTAAPVGPRIPAGIIERMNHKRAYAEKQQQYVQPALDRVLEARRDAQKENDRSAVRNCGDHEIERCHVGTEVPASVHKAAGAIAATPKRGQIAQEEAARKRLEALVSPSGKADKRRTQCNGRIRQGVRARLDFSSISGMGDALDQADKTLRQEHWREKHRNNGLGPTASGSSFILT